LQIVDEVMRLGQEGRRLAVERMATSKSNRPYRLYFFSSAQQQRDKELQAKLAFVSDCLLTLEQGQDHLQSLMEEWAGLLHRSSLHGEDIDDLKERTELAIAAVEL
jgi:hypothetical protein